MLELQDNTAFKDHLRDFLVQTKSFSSQDNADLFADEAAVAREVNCAVYSMWFVYQMYCLILCGIGRLCLVVSLLVLLA